MDGHDGMSRRALLGLARGGIGSTDRERDAVAARRRAAWERDGHEPLLRALEPVADVVASHAGARAGARVLDVGAGDGNVAAACSAKGASVDACDASMQMLRAGMARTGPAVGWREGAAEALPYGDEEFDTVVSAFGASWSPRPRRVARELARVMRPGGRLVLAAWMADTLPGALDAGLTGSVSPPSTWGSPDVARERLGPYFDEIGAEQRTVVLAFPSPDAMFAAFVAPLGVGSQRRESLRPTFDALQDAERDGSVAAHYLLITAQRPG